MKLMLRFMKPYTARIIITVILKFLAVISELFIPYTLEYVIDDIAPTKNMKLVALYGIVMVVFAVMGLFFNVMGNRMATYTSKNAIRNVRSELFEKTMFLGGEEFDRASLPSVISRMTSDSYNVQSFLGIVQRMGVRAPIMLLGGIIIAGRMDISLTLVLLCMIPVLAFIIIFISKKGIPMFRKVQGMLDGIVCIMRENISGVRVIRALSKHYYEKDRFEKQSDALAESDIKAGMVMALPNPVMTLFLNTGLTLIILIGAYRVNSGVMKTGVILAFLTYFNMIMQAVMGINRIFILYSKAGASADRIDDLLSIKNSVEDLPEDANDGTDSSKNDESDYAIIFDKVSIDKMGLKDISFKVKKGQSLGIIGSTGCGKTTILNLLLRFYDPDSGTISIDGKPVKYYSRKALRQKFGVVFQNDIIFNDTIYENIDFGRNLDKKDIEKGAQNAGIDDYIEGLPDKYQHILAIKGMNLSGGQRQRMLVARALAGGSEIIILDDSSSALDYRTDARLRENLKKNYPHVTKVMIAQRVSSVRDMNSIIVMDKGRIIGYGDHESLMENCETYRETYNMQMGEEMCNAANQ